MAGYNNVVCKELSQIASQTNIEDITPVNISNEIYETSLYEFHKFHMK